MHAPGTLYEASGQFIPKRLAISTLIGIILAVFIGWLYYLLSLVNPIIYLNFIVLGLAMFGAAAAFTIILYHSQSRHTKLNTAIVVLLCYLTWSSQWAFFNLHWHLGYSFWGGLLNPLTTLKIISARGDQIDIGHFSFRGGFQYLCYIAELAAFMLAAKWVTASKDYFCEDCKQFYTQRASHLVEPEIENFHLLQEMGGTDHQYRFLPQLVFVKKLTPIYAAQKPVVKVTLHYCAKCHENNIVSVSSFMQDLDSTNKLTTPLIKEQPITTGMYIAKATADALQRKFA
ncbi:hypothetical protein [Chitinophaga filiformis]|uniref:Uncharacterized protein n=1 Tax=Chitinophaga filiformis TaxID=104663 RepID=A0A1G7LG36_CHIFI|nr:hypothetical protein [Chitinophaga filiformis]SDF48381.1 hypothetical protein SAMN04488121_10252 [Chitinophaga filiformis]